MRYWSSLQIWTCIGADEEKISMSLVLKLLLIAVVFSDHGEGISDGLPAGDASWRSLVGPDALLQRLDKLLDMCIANYEDLTTDLLLGVAIANGKPRFE